MLQTVLLSREFKQVKVIGIGYFARGARTDPNGANLRIKSVPKATASRLKNGGRGAATTLRRDEIAISYSYNALKLAPFRTDSI